MSLVMISDGGATVVLLKNILSDLTTLQVVNFWAMFYVQRICNYKISFIPPHGKII